MITFKQYLAEKAMHRGAYAETLKRLGDDAKIGFELEFLVPEGSMFWADLGGRTPTNYIQIHRFDTMAEFDEYFDISNSYRRSIETDYGSWLAEKEDEFIDENWEQYDDDETAGRKAARRDFNAKDYDWTEWFHSTFRSPLQFVNEYGLEPKYGWYRDDMAVFTSEPESQDYQMGWRDTAEAIAKSLKLVVGETIRINSRGNGWNIYQDTSIKEDGLTGASIDDGMKGYGIEVVSPAMTPSKAFDALEKVLHWMGTSEVETNDSTGLHVNISTWNIDHLDPVKLVLFSGEQHILKKFDRLTNTFTRQQLQNIIDSIQTTGTLPKDAEEIKKRAHDALEETDKYWSANFKHMKTSNKYVEFRAVGGKEYHKRLDDLKEAVGRYLSAIETACDPDMDRSLYLKKLVGLLGKTAIAKDRQTLTTSPFEKLIIRYGGKIAMDEVEAALNWASSSATHDKNDLLSAARTVFLYMGQDDVTLDPTFDQVKGARDFLKKMGVTAAELLAAASDNRVYTRLLKGLKRFKLVK